MSDPNLKEKLRDSNRHLPWIKTVKERHGSVETSSLQQVEAINRSGVYMLRVQNALSLNYQQVQSQEHGKEYMKTLSQEDLDELRSKLMLISKTSESKEIVDKFIHDLQMAERLKVAAKSLNEAGCNLYRKMIIKVFCNPDKKRKGINNNLSKALAFSLQKQRDAIRLCNRKAIENAIHVANQASRK